MTTQDYAENTSRRASLGTVAALGAAAATLVAASLPRDAAAQRASALSDADILNFALNIEYLEAEYYLAAVRGSGLGPGELGPAAAPVRGGRQVTFGNPAFRQFAEELATNEAAHVRYLRSTLGTAAVPRPVIDLRGGFATLAQASGLGPNFDPFENETTFFLGGMLFEDVGVTAYKGAAPLIRDKEILRASAAILAAEAYHMGMVRSILYRMGPRARAAADAISDARDQLDGPEDLDQGIVLGGRANVVPANQKGIAFSRTPQQVLRILYLTARPGVGGGGFYPNGFNGAVRAT